MNRAPRFDAGHSSHRRWLRRFALVTLLLVGGGASATLFHSQDAVTAPITGADLGVALGTPDAVVRTTSLSGLLRDITRVPVARDLFGEDLAFYYETNPDRLGLDGTLRRIAYEHDLTLGDRLVASAFDQPADVLFWRGSKGALEHWAMAMTRGAMARLLQDAALAAASRQDRQLTAGAIDLGGTTQRIYALDYAPRRTLLLVTRGDRVLVLSSPGLLLDEDGQARAEAAVAVTRLLSGDAAQQAQVYDAAFPSTLAPAGSGGTSHVVQARLHYLSFGYQRYFPAFEALRLAFDGKTWSTSLLLQPAAPGAAAARDPRVWRAVPSDAAFCAALPVDWARGQSLVGAAGTALDLAAELDGPAAVCWYPDERLFAPLIVAPLRNPRQGLEPPLTALFDWAVQKSEDEVTAPVRADGVTRWTRDRQVPFRAANPESGAPEPGPMQVTLALAGSYALFSPDATLLARAVDTVARRYPSVADTLPRDDATLAVIEPRRISALLRQEAWLMLPAAEEPVLRAAAEGHLLPRLAKIERLPRYRLTVPAVSSGARQWQPVTFQELTR